MPEKAYAEQWDTAGLMDALESQFSVKMPVQEWAAEEGVANLEIRERIQADVEKAYLAKSDEVNAVSAAPVEEGKPTRMQQLERRVLLELIDRSWREHLQQIDQLRSVIGLRGYGQRDPLNEFKSEAFTLFDTMLNKLRTDVTRVLMNLQVQAPVAPPPPPPRMVETHIDPATGENMAAPQAADGGQAKAKGQAGQPKRTPPRNAPCPCGSGKKYKHCHGAL